MENIFILNNLEKNVLDMLSNKLLDVSVNHDTNIYMNRSILYGMSIPDRLRTFIQDFKNEKLKNDILIIKNLPVDENIITPENNKSYIGENTKLSRCQAIINQSIGDMIAYESESDGHLFQDMVPNKQLRGTQTSLGSDTELELHTEQAFSTLKPDYLSLACLKEDNNAKTYYLHLNHILDNITDEEKAVLEKNLWKIGVDLSFVMNGCSSEERGPISIIQNNNLVFDQDLMKGTTRNADDLIKKIINIYYENREHYILEKGDLLILNNNKLVHGRSNFNAKFDGTDRFIIRSFIIHSLKKIKDKTKESNDRIVRTVFS